MFARDGFLRGRDGVFEVIADCVEGLGEGVRLLEELWGGGWDFRNLQVSKRRYVQCLRMDVLTVYDQFVTVRFVV